MSSRPVWSTELVPGQAPKLHRESCFDKPKNKKKPKQTNKKTTTKISPELKMWDTGRDTTCGRKIKMVKLYFMSAHVYMCMFTYVWRCT